MSTDTRIEANLLFEARQLLIKALEESGFKMLEDSGDKVITGSGFGMGQADIDIKVDGRNFCLSMRLTDLDAHEKGYIKK